MDTINIFDYFLVMGLDTDKNSFFKEMINVNRNHL